MPFGIQQSMDGPLRVSPAESELAKYRRSLEFSIGYEASPTESKTRFEGTQQKPGAPYLARFSRDVGFHGSLTLTLDSCEALSSQHRGNPTSRAWPKSKESSRVVFLVH
jgi:hypothetical protein